MTVTAQPWGSSGTVILTCVGEIDIRVAPTLRAQVLDLIRHRTGVIIDLTSVSFFDSAAVRLVDDIARECAHHNAVVKAVAPPGTPARRVLDIVGMAALLATDTLDAALEAVARPLPPSGSNTDHASPS